MGLREGYSSLDDSGLDRGGAGYFEGHLGASFQQVLREANSMADGLAREGDFHSCISFDV